MATKATSALLLNIGDMVGPLHSDTAASTCSNSLGPHLGEICRASSYNSDKRQCGLNTTGLTLSLEATLLTQPAQSWLGHCP